VAWLTSRQAMICVSGAKIYRIITSNIRGPIILCGHMGKECRKHFKITKLFLILLKPENFGAEIECLTGPPRQNIYFI
jgi:hypothetical protein